MRTARHEIGAQGVAMKMGRWVGLLAAAVLVTGCGDFWQAPGGNSSTSFTLTNSGAITISSGSTTGTSTITVTPGSSFTGTVTLTCAVTTAPSNATSPTCDVSSTSLTFSSATAQTSTLTATTTSSTTTGIYDITVTGVSNSIAETTKVCVAVGVSSSGCTTTASSSGNFYILNSTSIAGYSISSGTLNQISGSSFTLSGALVMAIDPFGSYLWVATTGGITPYAINSSTGALTQGSAISAFNDPEVGALQVDPSGKWLLDASLSGTLYAFPITTSGTEDTNRSIQQNSQLISTSNGALVHGIAISPSGSTNPIVAVALGTSGTQVFPFISGNASPIGTAYSFGQSNSPTLTPYGSSGGAVAVAIDPSNRLLYIGETTAFSGSTTNSGALRVFTIGNGTLNEFTYSTPYAPLGTGPQAILPISTGDYVYVASWQSNVITGYSVTASALTALTSTVPTGTQPVGLTEDGTGSFVLTVNKGGSPYFDAFTFDATTTGKLDPSVTGSTGTGPIAIAAVP
jgi:6-phosphogluconolactonase (cycloisomerase 2 family)